MCPRRRGPTEWWHDLCDRRDRRPTPYVAVIFTSLQIDHTDGYAETADRMEALAARQAGCCLGIESARDPGTGRGITVSYWRTDATAGGTWRDRVAPSAHPICAVNAHRSLT